MNGADLIALAKKNPITVGCSIITLLFGGLIYFRSSHIPASTALLEQKSAEGARLAANLRNGGQLSEQLETLMAAGKVVDSRTVNAADLAQNLQYFYKLEAETGAKLLELRQVTVSVPGKATKVGGVAFNVTVRGDYPAVLNFLQRLEHGAHYCRVMNASVSYTGPDRTSAPITCTLGIELYGQP